MDYERGYDPYNKRDVCPDWLVNVDIEDARIYCGVIRQYQRRLQRDLRRWFTQQTEPGYDPYNSAERTRYAFTPSRHP